MVGAIIGGDAVLDIGGGERRVVERFTGGEKAADEAYAAVGSNCGVDGAVGPVGVQQGRVDVVDGAVGVDIAAWEMSEEERCPVLWCFGKELINIFIFRAL